MQKNVIYEDGELLLGDMPTTPQVIAQKVACSNYIEFTDDGSEDWLPPQIAYQVELEPNSTYLVNGALLRLTHSLTLGATLVYRFYFSGNISDYNVTGLNISKLTEAPIIQQFALIDNSEQDYFTANIDINETYSTINGTIITADVPNPIIRIYMTANFAVSSNIGDKIWSNTTALNKLIFTKLECEAPAPIEEEEEMLKVKLTDTSSNLNAVTWIEDTDMLLPLEANTKYSFEGVLFFHNADTVTARSASAKLVMPSGAVGYGLYVFGNGTANQYPRIMNANRWNLNSLASNTISQNAVGTVEVKGSIVTSATAGDLKVNWKPNVSISDNLTLKTGSYLKIIKQV